MGSVISPDALGLLLVNATLIASVAVLPVLVTGYAMCSARARKAELDFSLVKLECIELDRAILLYERVSDRLKEIQRECSHAGVGVLARYRQRRKLKAQFFEEEKELRAYAVHLRSTIVRLRGRPVRRFRRWVHLGSSEVAFSSCLMLYGSLFCLLLVVFSSDNPAWIQAAKENFAGFTWKIFGDHLFYANCLAGTVASVSLPMLYCIQLARLLSTHKTMLRELQAFAGADPDSLIPFPRADEQDDPPSGTQSSSPAQALDETWSDVLRVLPSAGVDEIKMAYKRLVKQNHPDRVADMAPRFRELAEVETKRINAAYEEALAWRQG
jgi:DnaJ-domain-containing protein 1